VFLLPFESSLLARMTFTVSDHIAKSKKGIEDGGPAEPGKRLAEGLDAEPSGQGVRQTPGRNPPRRPIDDRDRIQKFPPHRDVWAGALLQRANNSLARFISSCFQVLIIVGWTPNSDDSSARVFSPDSAAIATRALKSALYCFLFTPRLTPLWTGQP